MPPLAKKNKKHLHTHIDYVSDMLPRKPGRDIFQCILSASLILRRGTLTAYYISVLPRYKVFDAFLPPLSTERLRRCRNYYVSLPFLKVLSTFGFLSPPQQSTENIYFVIDFERKPSLPLHPLRPRAFVESARFLHPIIHKRVRVCIFLEYARLCSNDFEGGHNYFPLHINSWAFSGEPSVVTNMSGAERSSLLSSSMFRFFNFDIKNAWQIL